MSAYFSAWQCILTTCFTPNCMPAHLCAVPQQKAPRLICNSKCIRANLNMFLWFRSQTTRNKVNKYLNLLSSHCMVLSEEVVIYHAGSSKFLQCTYMAILSLSHVYLFFLTCRRTFLNPPTSSQTPDRET